MNEQRVTSILVHGQPRAKGSMKSIPFKDKATGKLRVNTFSDSKRSESWERTVKLEAMAAWRRKFGADALPLEGAVHLHMDFHMERPKSVTATKRPDPVVKPDIDKLVRLTLDALTGVVFRDDAQVTVIKAEKCYEEGMQMPSTLIEVFAVE